MKKSVLTLLVVFFATVLSSVANCKEERNFHYQYKGTDGVTYSIWMRYKPDPNNPRKDKAFTWVKSSKETEWSPCSISYIDDYGMKFTNGNNKYAVAFDFVNDILSVTVNGGTTVFKYELVE